MEIENANTLDFTVSRGVAEFITTLLRTAGGCGVAVPNDPLVDRFCDAQGRCGAEAILMGDA